MESILVATDFSTRSDRAIRRGVLLAKTYNASLMLTHVVDNDQPELRVKSEFSTASDLLGDQVASLRNVDGVTCSHKIFLGDPFEGIVAAVAETAPDLLVLGPHRRDALKDVFVGTTAERTIRGSRRPVLMANGVPTGYYRHALIAVDLSDYSGDAIKAVMALGLDKKMAVSVVYALDVPGSSLLSRASVTHEESEQYVADEKKKAADELSAFLAKLQFSPIHASVCLNISTVADTILSTARSASADLVVIGTRGRGAIAKLLLGSVAEEVLRISDLDVLAIPPAPDRSDAGTA
jgi:nucleotide-binding universal stress UspA family protein